MPEAVFDSTVLVSAFLTPKPGGASYELLRFSTGNAFALRLSPAILRETERVLLTTARLRKHFGYADADVHAFITELGVLADVTGEITDVPPVVRDPNDDMVVACAVAVNANYIVTRDKDLLDLGTHEGIEMVTPEAFLHIVRG
jgi:uncharacterized protein